MLLAGTAGTAELTAHRVHSAIVAACCRTIGAQAVGVVVLVLRRMTSAPLPSDRRRSAPALAVGGTAVLALVGL